MRFARSSNVPFLLAACAALLAAASVQAAAPRQLNYSRDIRPVLSNTCFKCHGPDEKERKAGLRLDTKEGALAKLESGEFGIVPGSSAKSTVYQRLTSADHDMKMPPADSGKTVTPEQIELIKNWIDQGANFKGHWSFIAPERSTVPDGKHADVTRNAIDRFLFARLESEGIAPAAEADKTTLIRRATFDLTGLPPTLAEVDAFLADASPNAYERLVDRLLDSPRYGEHQTRYWLDAARYGDTHGMHLDNERSLWPYRDWLIGAFNGNQPFDQFTTEQLAGDLLPNPTLDQKIATGFARCNVTTGEGGSIEEEFYVRYAVDRVETTGTVFLGLTVGCSACHDHKFDPITQNDFYRLFGYFNSLTEKAMDGNALLPPPVLRISTPDVLEAIAARQKDVAAVDGEIRAALDAFKYAEPANSKDAKVSFNAWHDEQRAKKGEGLPKPVSQALRARPKERTPEQRNVLLDHYVETVFSGSRPVFDPLLAKRSAAQARLDELDKSVPSTMVMQDMPERRDAFVLVRGAYDKKGEKVLPNVPAAIAPALPADAPPNRLSLAKWLVDPRHPLTARVTVNRFWQQYFGTGLVKTAEDFGSQGEWPTHPELLDWLATEFIRTGWNVKAMQRLIVTSAAYRQSSVVTPLALQKDAENRLISRGPRFRLDAEAIRDTALSLSGLLVPTLGGKSVKPYQPPGLWEPISYTSSNTAKFVRDTGAGLYRRSMYTFWKRTSAPVAMTTFDAPSREACVVRRSRTNTPLQALALMNDEQYVEASRRFAERMMRDGDASPAERIAFAFRTATSRAPSADEARVFQDLFEAQRAAYQKDGDAAKKLLAVGESRRDERLDAGELAAWTMVASVLLNLDETVTKG